MKYIYLFILSLFILGCNTKIDVTVLPTELELTVRNLQTNKDQEGAWVAVYDNLEKYLADNATFTTTGAIFKDTSDVDGKCNFTLQANKKYYIAAYFNDTVSLKNYGYNIYHDNGVTGYELLRVLNQSSKTYANITLTPAEGIVAFYADASNGGSLPIKVILGSDTLGTLYNTLNTPPTTISSDIIVRKMRRGVHPYRLINQIGCNSIDVFDVAGGSFQPIKSQVCNAGVASFSSDPKNVKLMPIGITVDGINIGSLLSTTQQLNYVIESGNHNYVARKDTCFWSGKFTITTNNYTSIKLDPCF